MCSVCFPNSNVTVADITRRKCTMKIICPMGTENVADALIALLADKEKQEALGKNCLSRDYSNAQSVNVLYDFIEN